MLLMLTVLLSADAWALTLSEIDIGEQIRGPHPTLTVDDLAGKVVLVDCWGIQCVPCIQQMPALQTLYNTYRFSGFHIIALERQAKTNAEAFEFFEKTPMFNGPLLQFQFTYTGRNPVPGRWIPQLPANFLFNSDGMLIGSYLHGEELEAKVKEAVTESLELMTKPGEVGRLADYERALKSGKDMIPTLSEIVRKKREALDSGDSKVIDEASILFTRVFEWANKKYDRAMADKNVKPMASLLRLKSVVRCLKGTRVADKAARAIEELENDPRIVKEVSADKALREVVTQISDMKSTASGSRDPYDPEFRKLNLSLLQSLKENCLRIQNVCPDTEAAAHSQVIVEDFRLKEVN